MSKYLNMQLSYHMIAPLLYGQRLWISLVASETQVLHSKVDTSPRQRASPYACWFGTRPTDPMPKPVEGVL
ncbi:hypothetical protein TSUD_105740 [Trifolium subterraneum]|uniref:Uncharacterized protein n=1 Tax=Trifolium subterraneum TaxID=3900 RepID=A0A2Z6LIQ2_TRISU|nr:hypothetical protein TSUD_105740 [Trifolium subterraneum]